MAAAASSSLIPAIIAFASGIIIALIGFVSAVLIESIRNKSVHKRERDARDAVRRDALLERRNEFQRQTLLALQDSAMKLMQTTTALHHADLMSYHEEGKWPTKPYPADTERENMLANAQTALLGVRVYDDVVRERLQQLKDKCTFGTLPFSDEALSRAAMREAGIIFVQLNKRIGEVLRSLDDFELQQ